MEDIKVKKFGPSCGKHGSSIFYKAFKYRKDGKSKVISLGQFFFMKIFESIPVCIAELQLVWEDKTSSTDLTSVRLYFLPECTPEGRQPSHGEDEVLAYYEKIVVKLSDLASLIVHNVSWSEGRTAFTALQHPTHPEYEELAEAFSMNSYGLDNRDIEKEKAIANGKQPVDTDPSPDVMVMSYQRYCRYRCMMKRLEKCEDQWLRHALVVAIGGYAAAKPNNRIYFCKDTFEHADLDDFEFRCDHLAPNLKGRPRKRSKATSKNDNDNDNNNKSSSEEEESSCSSSFSSQMNAAKMSAAYGISADNKTGARATPLRNGFRIDKVKVSKDEQSFLIDLHKFMKSRHTPIGRIPSLGFKQIDLFQFYTLAEDIGGYEQISNKRMWKTLYDKLGGNPGFTSAATCTRRHYEKLLLPYERYRDGLDGQDSQHHRHQQQKKHERYRDDHRTTSYDGKHHIDRHLSLDEKAMAKVQQKVRSVSESIDLSQVMRAQPLSNGSQSLSRSHPSTSNNSQGIMNKDLTMLADKALNLKQEIERMKMRKDAAKKLSSKETHNDTSSVTHTHSNMAVCKDERKAAASAGDNKGPVGSPTLDNRKNKWLEKGRRPSGGQKTVRELLHENGGELKDGSIPSLDKDSSEHKMHAHHGNDSGSNPIKTELGDITIPQYFPGLPTHIDSKSHAHLLPGFNMARPMFYPQMLPMPGMPGAVPSVGLPFMIPQLAGFGMQLPMHGLANPVSVKDEKPLHALDKLVSSHNEMLSKHSSKCSYQHGGSISTSASHSSRHNTASAISPPSAHSSTSKYPSLHSSTISSTSDLSHRSITPAHTNNSKRSYPFPETNRSAAHGYHGNLSDYKHESVIDKDSKRAKKVPSHSHSTSSYRASGSESDMPVLDLSMKTLKKEAKHPRGESLLFNASFNSSMDAKFNPKSEYLDSPQDLSFKSSYSPGDRHKSFVYNAPLPAHSSATMPTKKEPKSERGGVDSKMSSQAHGSKLSSNALAGLGTGLGGFDLASILNVHPAYLMQQPFPTPLQLQQIIQGQVATGMPFLRPDLIQNPFFPPSVSAMSPSVFSPGSSSTVRSSVSNTTPSKR